MRVGAASLKALVVLHGLAVVGAGGVATWLGSQRPGYSVLVMSMSILGERGAVRAGLFNGAVCVLGAVLVAAGLAVRGGDRTRRAPGAWIALSGLLLVGVGLVPIDPASTATTVVHRLLTGAVLACLVLAAFSKAPHGAATWFIALTNAVRWLAPAGVVLAVGLLVQGFPGGLWERSLLAILLVWVEALLVQLAQLSERASAATAAS